jgi:dihydropyrimidinase
VNKLLIRNGLVLTENSGTVCDLLCEGEKITRIGRNLAVFSPGMEEIDASGKIVIPGGVDVHTHLNLDAGIAVASDDFYTGTVAAAFGGTTTIVDHPAFGPAGCPLDHQIKKYHGFAEGKAVIDYGFHGVIQHVDGAVLQMMESLAAEGISSYKVYLTYGFKLSDGDALQVLKRAKELGVLVTVHPENDGVINLLREQFRAEGKTSPAYHPLSRPAECEAEAINRMILMAHIADDAPLYIVHLTNRLGLEFIRAARNRGQKNLLAETCPQYLLLDESLYGLPGSGRPSEKVKAGAGIQLHPSPLEGLKYIMCPPLRGPADQDALWKGLEADIDTVATDHCPFFFETQKIQGKDDFTTCPSGVPGIEERMPLLYSEGVTKKRIDLRRFVDLCCSNPAKIFGMYPQKGVLAPGSDADIVIIDPDRRTVLSKSMLHANVDYSAYEGFEVQGWPVCTISRGEVLVRDGKFYGTAGRGRFIRRGTSAETGLG